MLSRARLRIGALILDAEAAATRYLDRLAAIYEAPPIPRDERPAGLEVEIVERPGLRGIPEVPADGIVVRRPHDDAEVHTEAISMRLDRRAAAPRATIIVRHPEIPEYDLAVHLSVISAKLLALIGFVRLHAAASVLGPGAFVFVGDKGSGKSSITMAMGRAGATVLADDDVVVRRDEGRLIASGCDETIRMTAGTESHFFPEPLPVPPAPSGGELKKEIRADSLFPSRPYHEEPVEAVLFPRVSGSLELVPMTRGRAVLALLGATRTVLRFGGAEDHRHYLGLLDGLLAGVRAYDLRLAPDLGQLDELADRLAASRVSADGGR